jgi:hypothetical protein
MRITANDLETLLSSPLSSFGAVDLSNQDGGSESG